MVYPDTLHSLQIPLSLPLTSSYNNLEDDYSICAFSKIHGQHFFTINMCIYPFITHIHFTPHVLECFPFYMEKNEKEF